MSLGYWIFTQEDRSEGQHYERGETEFIVSNLVNSTISLFKAGKYPADAKQLPDFDGKSGWLPQGNYFLRYDNAGYALYFPVPLTGYRCGPDEDGTLLITIRPTPKQSPPRLLTTMPEFVYVPSGSVLIGDRQNPRERHYVWLTGYFIAPFEVSNEEFRLFLEAPDGYSDGANWTEEGVRWRSSSTSRVSALLSPVDGEYGRFGQPDQPVTWVTWYEANAFCTWLSRRNAHAKWQFSLPSDAEWEKGAHGPDNLDYSLSMFLSDAEVGLYNWKKNTDAPIPVVGILPSISSYRPNRYGLYHMTGNVVEWTQSVYVPYNREHPFLDDERNHDRTSGPRTARGGSWYSAAISYMYIPYRDSFQPSHSTQDLGFRLICRALP
jgi:formylglycine-generating enzyme required for sulfatase activity